MQGRGNIYNAIELLKSLEHSSTLTTQQKEFIKKILAGKKGKSLEDHARLLSVKDLEFIVKQLDQALKKTYFWQTADEDKLRNARAFILNALYLKNRIKNSSVNHFGKALDHLYKATVVQYHGMVMLPVNQGLDFRLGSSEGECFGWLLEWMKAMLNEGRPFGIDYRKPAFLKPIKFCSDVGREYPELNHLAILTEKIAKAQISGNSCFKTLEYLSKDSKKTIDSRLVKDFESFQKPVEIADNLLHFAKQNPEHVCHITVTNYSSGGHALGFYKDKEGMCHFIDANVGWFIFKNGSDFRKWFKCYFNQLHYHKLFTDYAIEAYGCNFSKDLPKPTLWQMYLSEVARNLRFEIKKNLRDFQNTSMQLFGERNSSESEAELKDIPLKPFLSFYTKERRKRNALEKKRIQNVRSSYSRIGGMLDVSWDDFVVADEHAVINQEFKLPRQLPKSSAQLEEKKGEQVLTFAFKRA